MNSWPVQIAIAVGAAVAAVSVERLAPAKVEAVNADTNTVAAVVEEWPTYDNLEYGIPDQDNKELCTSRLDREGFCTGYDPDRKQPVWVMYRLTANEVTNRVAKRLSTFSIDPEVCVPSTNDDYKRSGYDRGHIAPAGDMAWSHRAMYNSFFLSNMSPQAPQFNRGIWKDLESWVRDTAVKEGSVIVASGPIFCRDLASPKAIGKSQVEVPLAYFKVLCTETEPRKGIGFILFNKSSSRPLRDYAVSVRHVEAMTGLNFYDRLPTDEQDAMELNVRLDEWGL